MTSSNPTQKLLKEIGFTLLSEGKTIKVRAEGYSMYPSIRPGSVILIEPLENDEIPLKGEIIAWKRDSGLVVHRITGIIENDGKHFFITRGDSSLTYDETVPNESVAGRVVGIEDAHGRQISPETYLVRRNAYWLNRFRLKAVLHLKKFQRIIGR